jgi:transposase-like protein
MNTEPKTLQQATVYFADPDNCINFLVSRRWPDGVVKCPICGTEGAKFMPAPRRVWQCKKRHPRSQFSIKVGTIFEDSALPLDKWLMVMWMIANCRNGISSHEIARAVGVTQKSAWHMLHRVRLAMKDVMPAKLGNSGPVEADECFIGPKPQAMHADRRLKLKVGANGYADKIAVFGMLDRDTRQVRAKVVPNAKRETLQAQILAGVERKATVYTDRWSGYDGLAAREFIHDTVNHSVEYVKGQVHTQSIENFWSLLKRGLTGTYVAVEPFHLDRYLDEQMYRFNNRINTDDAMRFTKLVDQIVGKRLTYAELTGKDATQQAN